MHNRELVRVSLVEQISHVCLAFMLEFDQKKEKNGVFNFMCHHFSSTFEGRNLSF